MTWPNRFSRGVSSLPAWHHVCLVRGEIRARNCLAAPHLILRGKDDSGKPIFVEILTWRDHEAADHVPAEVQAIWNQMQALVENREGHRGIEFPEFEIVSSVP
jgi:hypothetical protein